MAHVGEGEEAEALKALQEAVALGARGCYIRTLVDKGPALWKLIGRLPDEAWTSQSKYRKRLMGAVEMVRGTLTARETEVLGLVAEGCKNIEIAITLGVSEGTIRKHVESIYRKLEVTGRVQAVSKARTLGLL